MMLETAYADGQLAALRRHKLGWPAPTNPTVASSSVLGGTSPSGTSATAQQAMQPPTTPHQLAQVFDAHEQGKTRTEPRRKLSATDMCTSCRSPKHYGACSKPRPIPPKPEKAADFNMGMCGDDPTGGSGPSTSPHYHSATTADSALARARDGRPANEQAATGFADLFRHLGITSVADEPGQMTGSLDKVAKRKLADFMLPGSAGHSMHEQRGPSVNPYEERRTVMGPPAATGPQGEQVIERMFREFDNPVDTTNVGGGFGDPQPGPAALG
jgi:hypothetical protein